MGARGTRTGLWLPELIVATGADTVGAELSAVVVGLEGLGKALLTASTKTHPVSSS